MINWEAIGAMGEVGGTLAVVASLIYLAQQIRHANRQSEIESLRHTWDGLNQFCDLVSQSPHVAATINRGRGDYHALGDDDRLAFYHTHLRLLNTLEAWYLQIERTSKPGAYRDSQIANIEGIVQGYLNFPGVRQLWHEEIREFFPPIADIVDRNLSDDSPATA
ncbi:MAG: hypothetical protein AAGE01_12350 [Pseudomonadota bacterium]